MESSREGGDTPSSVPPEGEGLVSPEGYISLDRSSYSVGDTAVVTWEMLDTPPHQKDFIGMFELEQGDTPQPTLGRLLDSRLRGDTSLRGGRLQWHLAKDVFPTCEPHPIKQFVTISMSK